MNIKSFHNGEWGEATPEEKELVYSQMRMMGMPPFLLIVGLLWMMLMPHPTKEKVE